MLKKITNSLKKIQRNTKLNKCYLSKIKTYKNKCLYYIKKQLFEKNCNYFTIIFKNFNLAFKFLDKSEKLKILNKNLVARKKAQLHKKLNIFVKLSK
jgi:ribosomal protein S20